MMKLYIKAYSAKEAKREASRHGIGVRRCKMSKFKGRGVNEVLCDAPCADRTLLRVMRWFNEKAQKSTKQGHAGGTLLFYSDKECSRPGGGPKRGRSK